MINCYRRDLKDSILNKLKNFERGSWINVIDPSDKDIDFLSKKFELDKQNLISGLDKDEVPRMELVDDYTYIILKVISQEDNKSLHTFLIVIADHFILTLCKIKPDFVEQILQNNLKFITTQKIKCLLKLISCINKDFEKATYNTIKVINSKKKDINDLHESDLNSLLENESLLNSISSSYYYFVLVYEKILKNLKFNEEEKGVMEDLLIEVKQGFDLCKSSLKTIANIRDHLVIVLSNKLSKVIALLTILTVFISVPAAIFGFFGMNLNLPLKSNPDVFYFIFGFVALIWIGFIVYFRRKRLFLKS